MVTEKGKEFSRLKEEETKSFDVGAAEIAGCECELIFQISLPSPILPHPRHPERDCHGIRGSETPLMYFLGYGYCYDVPYLILFTGLFWPFISVSESSDACVAKLNGRLNLGLRHCFDS